jgi:oligoendopeptidase F
MHLLLIGSDSMHDNRHPTPLAAANLPASAQSQPDLGSLPQWRLSDLYPSMDSPAYANDLSQALAECKAFADNYRGRLEELAKGPNASQSLGEAVRSYEAIEDRLGKIISYAGLIYFADTSNPAHMKFYGDAQEKITDATSDILFFTLELNRIDDQLLDKAAEQSPLSHYRPWLEDIRREKPYQLDDKIEQLFHEKAVTGRNAWNRLFDETLAGLRFHIKGQDLSITQAQNLMQDPDEAIRKEASIGIAKTLGDNLRTFALITNTLAKDKEISDRWRGFEDIADSRHLANRVEREVVDAMVSAVEGAHPRLSHRYYKLKAKWFGKDQLDHWDRNAPLPNAANRDYRWEEARDIILNAYSDFSPKMSAIAKRFFDESWIDAPVRAGKQSGAFAHPTVPSAHPYVLVNYMGKPRDVMTLAHELGHGVHQVLAGPNGALMAPTPLTLAETASVFGEMLTFRALLRQSGPEQRRTLLAQKVEDMLNTVVRQIAFYSFERKLHTQRRSGELTAEQICETWMSVQASSLGPGVRLGPGYETYWSYIPHFIHSPFYVYAYAFGDCLVNSLYGRYEKSADGFVEKYFALLSAGGTKHHSQLLAPFGLDARDPGFWQIGLNMISGMIDELETIDQI